MKDREKESFTKKNTKAPARKVIAVSGVTMRKRSGDHRCVILIKRDSFAMPRGI